MERYLALSCILFILLGACGSAPTVSTPAEPSITPSHTKTLVPPTFTSTPTLRSTDTPLPPTSTHAPDGKLVCTYRVSAFEHSTAKQYLDTGLNIKQGEHLVITATGIACCDTDPTVCCSGPDGHPAFDDTDLVGRIGNGDMFHIGASFQKEISENDAGRLYLGYHDADYANNSGFFDVIVVIENTLVGNCPLE